MYGPMMGNWDQMWQWMWTMQLAWMLPLLLAVIAVVVATVVMLRRAHPTRSRIPRSGQETRGS